MLVTKLTTASRDGCMSTHCLENDDVNATKDTIATGKAKIIYTKLALSALAPLYD
jgi:hypothetical protein